jgi:hypothetical protein
MGLEQVSNVLIDEAIRMEEMAARLEVLIPAVQHRAVDDIARRAVGLADFGGSAELFDTASAEETIARFERARRRLMAVLDTPQERARP